MGYIQRQSRKNESVTICSIDPAPSLDDIFQTKISDQAQPVLRDRKFLAAEFDAMAQFRRWTDDLRARLQGALTTDDRGLHLDLTLDRNFLLALLDVIPPGVDEIFAVFQILELLQDGGRVIIDMAPTGHALEVLQTPTRLLAWSRLLLKTLAAHRSLPLARDAAVEVAALSQNVRELSAILRDAKRSSVVVVTLPEPLPTHETRALLVALGKLEAPVQCVFINRVLIRDADRCSRCKLALAWQAAALGTLRQQLRAKDLFVSQEMHESVAGARGLKKFTGKIWRLK
jgi:arsenite-transporting ATPase